ncbi:hypothetical protein M8J76_013300 [Diaphorina citri]|nr:hypothetical protein M8J76_013300 [Diaphorina citri]
MEQQNANRPEDYELHGDAAILPLSKNIFSSKVNLHRSITMKFVLFGTVCILLLHLALSDPPITTARPNNEITTKSDPAAKLLDKITKIYTDHITKLIVSGKLHAELAKIANATQVANGKHVANTTDVKVEGRFLWNFLPEAIHIVFPVVEELVTDVAPAVAHEIGKIFKK